MTCPTHPDSSPSWCMSCHPEKMDAAVEQFKRAGEVCPTCKGTFKVWSPILLKMIPCPECKARAGQAKTENALDASDEWREKAEACVRSIARRIRIFSSDEVIWEFELHYPNLKTHGDRDERRRWGPLMKRMAKEGVMEATGTRRSMRRNKAWITEYTSLIWQQPVAATG